MKTQLLTIILIFVAFLAPDKTRAAADTNLAEHSNTGSVLKTDFTYNTQEPSVCPCIGEFIKPDWIDQEHLLNFPLNNEIWIGDAAADPGAWIGIGVPQNTLIFKDKDGVSTFRSGNSAVITLGGRIAEALGGERVTNLTHTYATTIYDGQVTIVDPGEIGSKTHYGFASDTIVPLYYIQNDDHLFLTVVPKCYLPNQNTNDDVYGVKLEWLPKYEWFTNAGDEDKTLIDLYGYDLRALQLFAITGCQTPQPDENYKYGKFAYLPLASYLWSYREGHAAIDDDGFFEITFNYNLGKTYENENGCVENDITDCYRITHYTRGSLVKDLILSNPNGDIDKSSFPPIEVKLWKENDINDLIEKVHNSSFYAYFVDNTLKIESSNMELINIYSATGVQFYSIMKDAGLIEIPLKSLRGMFIIKGSKSGVIKVVR